MLISSTILNQFFLKGINSVISGALIFLVAFVAYFFLKRRADNLKQKKRLRSRALYISVFIFALVLIKIWVDGFTHLFTMLSLIGAGLVVSNKETIMNVVGWLIINWRGLFVEGDYIQIQHYVGYVDKIHLLYFKMYEINSLDKCQITGKTIKVPNGLAITSPVLTFSPETHVANYGFSFFLKWTADLDQVLTVSRDIIKALFEKTYGGLQALDVKKNRALASLIDLPAKVSANLSKDNPKLIRVTVEYYCRAKDSRLIEEQFLQQLQAKNVNNQLGLACEE